MEKVKREMIQSVVFKTAKKKKKKSKKNNGGKNTNTNRVSLHCPQKSVFSSGFFPSTFSESPFLHPPFFLIPLLMHSSCVCIF